MIQVKHYVCLIYQNNNILPHIQKNGGIIYDNGSFQQRLAGWSSAY